MTKQELLEYGLVRMKYLKWSFDVVSENASSCASRLANYDNLSLKEIQDMFFYLTITTDELARYMIAKSGVLK